MALQGNIEQIGRAGVSGWVRDDAAPDRPVSLLITVEGQFTLRVLANAYRQDLEHAGFGMGRHGFSAPFEGLSPFQPHLARLVREEDGAPLPGSPLTIPARARFDSEVQDYLAGMLGDVGDDDELLARAGFLAQQADRLLQMRADRRVAPALRPFEARWAGREAAAPAPAPRALVIDDRLPAPHRDAGSMALLSHMKALQQLGYGVTVVANNVRGGPEAGALAADGFTACHAPWVGSVEEVLRREAGGFALVYLHRASNTRYLPLIRHHQPRARVVYCVADLHHLRLARQAEVEQRPELAEYAHRVRQAELAAAGMVDAVITHSTAEADILRRDAPMARVHVVPWAVEQIRADAPFAERNGLAFVGSYGHPPNLDAAWWLLQDILPMLRARAPHIGCLMAGSEMPDSLRAAARPGVAMLGHVPDLAGVFRRVRLTVAPLAYGAGVKGKVLDSLAAGLPCACTPVAAEGLDLPPALQALTANTAEGLVDVILRLHEDEAFNRACAEAGLAFVAAQWAQPRVAALMQAVVQPPRG